MADLLALLLVNKWIYWQSIAEPDGRSWQAFVTCRVWAVRLWLDHQTVRREHMNHQLWLSIFNDWFEHREPEFNSNSSTAYAQLYQAWSGRGKRACINKTNSNTKSTNSRPVVGRRAVSKYTLNGLRFQQLIPFISVVRAAPQKVLF